MLCKLPSGARRAMNALVTSSCRSDFFTSSIMKDIKQYSLLIEGIQYAVMTNNADIILLFHPVEKMQY